VGHNYSEAAHIVGLERRLPGIDSYLNIVIVCATCHRKMDHGGMQIEYDDIVKRCSTCAAALRSSAAHGGYGDPD